MSQVNRGPLLNDIEMDLEALNAAHDTLICMLRGTENLFNMFEEVSERELALLQRLLQRTETLHLELKHFQDNVTKALTNPRLAPGRPK